MGWRFKKRGFRKYFSHRQHDTGLFTRPRPIVDIRVGPRMPGFRTGFPATNPVDVHLYATVMGFQRRPSACSILARMPEFLRQSAVRAADSHQAISRRDILKWGIASSVLLAALARSVQPLLDQLAWQFFDIGAYFGTDVPMHLELIVLMLEYNVLVWVLPLPFAAVTIHALRKPEDSESRHSWANANVHNWPRLCQKSDHNETVGKLCTFPLRLTVKQDE